MAKVNLKSFDLKALGQYFSPRALDDLNSFIEKLPQNAGQTVLIAAGVAWVFVGALGLFTTMKAQDLTNLRAQLQDAKALKPVVPILSEVPVDQATIADFAKKLSQTYKILDARPNGNTITIMAQGTSAFNLFREAVLQVQNGGLGWKISLDKLCVGRECGQNHLSISMKINKITIDKPAFESVDYTVQPTTDPLTPTGE